MTTDEILFDTEERMEKAVNVFRDELRGLRTGRATPALVENIRVEYYGSPTPLKAMAHISTPDPQHLIIKPFDAAMPQGHRKGDPLQRPGHGPQQRRQDDPSAGAAHERRAAAKDGRNASRNPPRTPRWPAATSAATATSISTSPRKNKEMTEDDRDKGKEQVQTLLKDVRGEDPGNGRQEGEGNHGAVAGCRPKGRKPWPL